jgi:hypothetical protein
MGKPNTARMLWFVWLAIGAGLGAAQVRAEAAPAALQYQSPRPGAQYVQPATTLAVRLDGLLNPISVSAALWEVEGTVSGPHPGQAQLARDGQTAIFTPAQPFAPGETVTVRLRPGLETAAGGVYAGTDYAFTISTATPDFARQALEALRVSADEDEIAPPATSSAAAPAAPSGPPPTGVFPGEYVTVPDDVQPYTITVPASGTVAGYYFFNMRQVNGLAPAYLYILDQAGGLVYHQTLAPGARGMDFKRQPDGRLSYFDHNGDAYRLLDHTYAEVRAITAGNGYTADEHDMQILPSGEALLLIYDPQPMDMSAVITGGVPTATVIGLVVQAIDLDDNVVFEWRSWDHFLITDTTVPLTTTLVDYVHGNAVEQDVDGNLLISSRHLDEITKLDRATGDVLWRWGGPNNEFTFVGDPEGGFFHQHDIRRQPDGQMTLFDNHMLVHNVPPPFSRAVAYAVDEISKTATLMWAHRNTPDVVSGAMGSHQRVADGHVVVGWGTGRPNFTDVWAADGAPRFEVLLPLNQRAYRAFRLPWAVQPGWPLALVLTDTAAAGLGAAGPALYFSWNGATAVAAYEVWGGNGPAPDQLLGEWSRTGFEDHVPLADVLPAAPNACAFRMRALDAEGLPLAWSPVVFSRAPCNEWEAWFPLIFGP